MCYVCMFVFVISLYCVLCSSLHRELLTLAYLCCLCVRFICDVSFISTSSSSSIFFPFFLRCCFFQPFLLSILFFFSPFYFKTISLCALLSLIPQNYSSSLFFQVSFSNRCWFVNFHSTQSTRMDEATTKNAHSNVI